MTREDLNKQYSQLAAEVGDIQFKANALQQAFEKRIGEYTQQVTEKIKAMSSLNDQLANLSKKEPLQESSPNASTQTTPSTDAA